MSRILLVVAAFLALAAGAAWSTPDGDRHDSVAGGGTFGPGCFDGPASLCFGTRRDFSLDAHGGQKGQNPTGLLYYGRNEPSAATAVRRDVVCMRVEGNVAVVGGTYLEASAGNAVWGWAIRVEDYGPPGPGPDDRSGPLGVDTLENFAAEIPGFPETCPPLDWAFFESNGSQPVHSGDIVVRDGKS